MIARYVLQRFFGLALLSGLMLGAFSVEAQEPLQDPVYGGVQTYPQPTYPTTSPPPKEEPGFAADFVTGFASFLVTPVYGAAKIIFAGLGGLTGGLAWAFSGGSTDVANKIWRPALKGTYIITPDHLAGRKPIEFIGR